MLIRKYPENQVIALTINQELLQVSSAIRGEIDIAESLRSGDEETINYIFNTFFDRLYSYVFNAVGKNGAVAEDIVQDTFIGAVKSARNFNGNSQIYTWLVSIAHHKMADYFRRQKREKAQTNLDTDIVLQNAGLIEKTSVADIVESAEDRILIEQALSSLPFEYRQTLVLKYVEDLSVVEISRIMKRSPKSVEGLLSRARKSLKMILENTGKG
ncbi:MAG: RNA polymerase sigma factor [Dehalococcoidales bacterium]|nr:RNA polymerase sigma factor [Dehalococcoidales bacterium]